MAREARFSDQNELRQSNALDRVALLTLSGAAAIAVMRMAGPGVPAFLQKHFSKSVSDGRCVHGLLRDGQSVIDDPVIVSTSNGLVADVNLHGGEWVVRASMELAQRNGFERVDVIPDHGKGKLHQEIASALPNARTDLAIRILLGQEDLWNQVKPDADLIQKILADRTLWWLLHPPKVAIIGAANVGKSTLANQLFGQDRSITADIPGTTRDWVGDWTSIDGLPLLLVDTPGLRKSDDAIEQAAIIQSRREINEADLLIVVLDPTRPLAPQEELIAQDNQRTLKVINKSDLPRVWDHQMDGVAIVATTGHGLAQLRERIRACFITSIEEPTPHWWTIRQRSILERTLLHSAAFSELF